MANKLDKAYKTIGEVADLLNLKNTYNGKLNTYILRYWEKEFKQIKPLLLNNRRRYYDKKTINLLIKIKYLLKDQGMTIKGVKNILDNKTIDLDDQSKPPINVTGKNFKTRLNKISSILKEIKKL
tara:strand:- start:359 stop:733 length:375 start_codon:yes stop_codon:yes gene_type:complete